MRLGFAKNNITPRVGVELCGFGPFLCRRSIGVRDKLWARAMAVEHETSRVAIVTCDLIGVTRDIARRIREIVGRKTGLPGDAVMICCSHTHSGPSVGSYIGWGEADTVYVETLPSRIAAACVAAMENLEEATLAHAEVPCEGIGLNREYDMDAPPLELVLQDGWRPDKPELTDTTCHVLTARSAAGELLGFVSYFSCHPITCCAETRYIHGDFCGVATNMLERETPGSVGLFIQGAQGDVNTCAVHKPEMESLAALDIIASRYANAVRGGIDRASPIEVDHIRSHSRDVAFSRKPWGLQKLQKLLAEKESRVHCEEATDDYSTTDWDIRMETVYLTALQRLVAKAQRGEDLSSPTEIHGVRIGPVTILGSGFEIMQAIKNDVTSAAAGPIILVAGLVNDSVGYAPDRTIASRGGYAVDMVPIMCGMLPYKDAHGELMAALLAVDRELHL